MSSRRALTGVVTALLVALWIASPTPAAAQDHWFDSDGVRIRYIERGQGTPIVLIHGIAESADKWIATGIVDDLAKDFRVIAFDMRGHGKSGKPHDPRQYGRAMALDIVRLLDHLTIPRAHVVGYSLGGIVTAHLLVLHPERFLTATLVAGSPRIEWTPDVERAAEQEASERERECVSRTLIYRLAPTDQPKPTEDAIRERSEQCRADPLMDQWAIAAVTRSRKDQVITPSQAAAVTVPTHAIVGDQDGFLAQLRTLKTLRPAMTLTVIAGAAHSGPRGVLSRRELVPSIRAFIAAQAPPPTGFTKRQSGIIVVK